MRPRSATIFKTWNEGDLESFLIEITAEVLGHVDAETGKAFVDIVLDQAEQKGTGRWTVQNALDLGVPITGIAEATFARALSGSVPQRRSRPGQTGRATPRSGRSRTATAFVEDVRQALYASKVVAYSQGFDQIAAASAEYGWNIDRGAMARIWRGGCIIRARFLNRITEAYERNPELPLLLADDYFADAVGQLPGGLAPGGRRGRPERHPDARRSPRRWPTTTGSGPSGCRGPDPGAAGLLRCPHLPTGSTRRVRSTPSGAGIGRRSRSGAEFKREVSEPKEAEKVDTPPQ